MIEREYLKYNASIQTGSNADHLLTDTEGNVEAKIELRLPDNLFSKNTGTKKVDKVELQASKFRISMQNTPLAQLPIDTEHLSATLIPTKCELDVYPFCLLDDNKLFPDLLTDPTAATAFPNYKNHKIKYIVYYTTQADIRDPDNTIKLCEIDTVANNEDLEFPKTSTLFEVLKNAKVLRTDHHIMQLCAQTNHEPFDLSSSYLYIKNMGTLEQMWQDALQNAITYAMTSSDITISIWLIRTDIVDPLINGGLISPIPDKTLSVKINGQDACIWKIENSTTNSCSLVTETKPIVHFDQQSFSIAYDSVAFPETIPIAWNPPFVETGDHPEQLTIDTLRSDVWTQPPPKRQYLYDTTQTETSYNFAIDPNTSCLPMNIIANKEIKERFSFLPWIEVDTTKLDLFKKTPKYHVKETVVTRTYTGEYALKNVMFEYNGNNFTSYQLRGQFYGTNPEGSILTYTYQIDPDTSERINQKMSWGGSAIQRSGWVFKRSDPLLLETEELQTVEQGAQISEVEEVILEYDIYDGEQPNNETSAMQKISITDTTPIPQHVILSKTNNTNILYQVCKGKDANGTPIYQNIQCPHTGTWIDTISIQQAVIPDWLALTSTYDEATQTYTKTFSSVVQDGITGNDRTYFYYANVPSGNTSAIGNIKQSGTIVYQYRKKEVTVLNATAVSYRPKLLPNLKLTDDKFYIIDGTTADVNIGAVEPIKIADTLPEIYQTTVETTTEIFDAPGCVKTKAYNEVCIRYYQKLTNAQLGDPSLRIVYDYDSSTRYFSNLLVDDTDDAVQTNLRKVLKQEGETITDDKTEYKKTTETRTKTITTTTEPQTISDTTTISETETEEDVESEIQNIAEKSEYFEGFFFTDVEKTQLQHFICTSPAYNISIPSSTTAGTIMLPEEIYKLPLSSVTITQEGTSYHYRLTLALATTEGGVCELGTSPNTISYFIPYSYGFNDDYQKQIITYTARKTRTTVRTKVEKIQPIRTGQAQYKGNVHLTFNWNNLPVVVLSPIQSIVLQLTGMTVNHEFYPINIQQKEGSSLTSTIPIIENYYSLASTLRDLHDELVVTKQSFDDTPVYNVTKSSGEERILTLSACYITKDGSVHQIYIPKNGVFTLQLTFGISFYTSS